MKIALGGLPIDGAQRKQISFKRLLRLGTS